MKTRKTLSSAKKARIGSYLSACAAWAASSTDASAEIIHGYFAADKQPITFDPTDNAGIQYNIDNTTDAYPGAGIFLFNLVPRGGGGENLAPYNGSLIGVGLDSNGDPGTTDLTLATTGNQIDLRWNYYGAALVRYTEGQTIQGDSILNSTATDYTGGYLFEFDDGGATVPSSGQFIGQTSGYLGFAFTGADPNNGNNPTTYTGWIYISNIATDYSSFSILDWAYTAGNTIDAGDAPVGSSEAVPEPSSLGLLAVGAVGLARYRRRRKAAQLPTDATPAA